MSFPLPVAPDERRHSFKGLYDICLALTMEQSIVGNEVHADRKDLVIITGANQGGKSTFLRSIGLAQVMMQCGMFVPAESFCANVCEGLFTHYNKQEAEHLVWAIERMHVAWLQVDRIVFNETRNAYELECSYRGPAGWLGARAIWRSQRITSPREWIGLLTKHRDTL